MKPGEYFLESDDIEINAFASAVSMVVKNTGDRPVQVGSHFHFFEVNRALDFDRQAAYGKRINIPSGTAIRFEPGQSHTVELVPITGERVIYGFNRLVEGSLETQVDQATSKLADFKDGQ